MLAAMTLVLRQGRLRAPREPGLYRSVFVPLDGSAFAEQALGAAIGVASAVEANLVLLRVHQHQRIDRQHAAEWDAMLRSDEEAYLERVLAGVVEHACPDASAEVLDGDVAAAICARASSVDAPLVVMSSHGRTGLTRSWLGSVADGVVRNAAMPVLIVRPSRPELDPAAAPRASSFENVIIALDGSSIAAQILPHAIGLADAMRAHVILLRIETPDETLRDAEEYVRSVANRIRFVHTGLCVACDVRLARDPAAAIIASARATPHALVALATHGRGLSRFVVGSVADAVIRRGEAPVLVIRATAS